MLSTAHLATVAPSTPTPRSRPARVSRVLRAVAGGGTPTGGGASATPNGPSAPPPPSAKPTSPASFGVVSSTGGFQAQIKVIGCGGGGSNAVNRMATAGVPGVGLYVMNTDAQALSTAAVPTANRLQIGKELTRGLGAGGNPEIGAAAAKESRDAIARVVQGCDMVFVTAGMGGGTGSGSAPVVAAIARELGILTVGIVTLPFTFEGRLRRQQAIDAVNKLRETVDTIIVVPNDKLLSTVSADVSVMDAFKIADMVLQVRTTQKWREDGEDR